MELKRSGKAGRYVSKENKLNVAVRMILILVLIPERLDFANTAVITLANVFC